MGNRLTKSAWLWIADFGVFGQHKTSFVCADLFFSTPTKLKELCSWLDKEQLVEVKVPLDFDTWDFVPENY